MLPFFFQDLLWIWIFLMLHSVSRLETIYSQGLIYTKWEFGRVAFFLSCLLTQFYTVYTGSMYFSVLSASIPLIAEKGKQHQLTKSNLIPCFPKLFCMQLVYSLTCLQVLNSDLISKMATNSRISQEICFLPYLACGPAVHTISESSVYYYSLKMF